MTIAQDHNPKRRAGALKVPLEYVPTVAETYIALVLEGGAQKYGPFNWRNEAISISTYVGAIRRHIGAIMDGQDIDEESGLPHWAHIAASCAIALDALAVGKLIDDRPVQGASPELMAAIRSQRAAEQEPAQEEVRLPYPIQTCSHETIEAYIKYLNTPLADCPPRLKSEDQVAYLMRCFGRDEE